jgi:hypothetical protein
MPQVFAARTAPFPSKCWLRRRAFWRFRRFPGPNPGSYPQAGTRTPRRPGCRADGPGCSADFRGFACSEPRLRRDSVKIRRVLP